MLEFSRKFYFGDGGRLGEIAERTLGATVYADGSFEAAADEELPGEELGISSKLIVRVTAKNEKDRVYWTWKILEAIEGHATLDTTEKGYWGPTDEYEPSWRIDTELDGPNPELLKVIYDWLVDADQMSVYLEFAGRVLILDRDEVPAFAAELVR